MKLRLKLCKPEHDVWLSTNTKVVAAIGGVLLAFVALAAVVERHALPMILPLLGEDIRGALSKVLFHAAGQPVRVWFVIKSCLYLAFLVFLSRCTVYFVHLVTRRTAFGEHRQYVLSRVISSLIYVVGVLIGIHAERIQFGTLVILGSTLGVGLGLALQPLVGNLIAGIILFIEQPMHISDIIEFGDKAGQVVKIGARCSWIRTSDNALLIIPNSEFTSKDILNWTSNDPRVRLSLPVSVAYGSDIAKVTQLLLTLAQRHEDVLATPAPEVLIIGLGESAIALALRVWTIKGIDDLTKLRSAIYRDLIETFALESIPLPVPHLDIHYSGADMVLRDFQHARPGAVPQSK